MSGTEVVIMSFPRSGQQMMRMMVESVYRRYGIKFSYCAYYTECGCETTPCRGGGIFQKQHDLGLGRLSANPLLKRKSEAPGEPIDQRYKYLVMYRNDLITQLEAYFRFDMRKERGERWKKPFDYNDNEWLCGQLVEFIEKNKKYYLDFVKKWVNNGCSNCLTMEYGDVVSNPVDNMMRVLQFLKPEVDFDREAVSTVLGDRISLRYRLDDSVYERIRGEIE